MLELKDKLQELAPAGGTALQRRYPKMFCLRWSISAINARRHRRASNRPRLLATPEVGKDFETLFRAAMAAMK